MKKINLFISIPSNRDWKGRFGASLAYLIHYLSSHKIKMPGYELSGFTLRSWGNSSCLSVARQMFVDEMLAGDYTHWLSLDDDMTFPMDIVDKLLSHGKEVVSVNARLKSDVIQGSLLDLEGKPLDSTGKKGLQEIKTMGGAIFLASIDSFRNIPKPHFQVLWSDHHQNYIGEDMYFSGLLKVNGVRLWCDHDVSQEIGHVGDFEYKFPFDNQILSLVA